MGRRTNCLIHLWNHHWKCTSENIQKTVKEHVGDIFLRRLSNCRFMNHDLPREKKHFLCSETALIKSE